MVAHGCTCPKPAYELKPTVAVSVPMLANVTRRRALRQSRRSESIVVQSLFLGETVKEALRSRQKAPAIGGLANRPRLPGSLRAARLYVVQSGQEAETFTFGNKRRSGTG